MIVNESPYKVQLKDVLGLWQLRNKQVFAFTATSSVPYERLVNNCITKPTVLKFKSEFEMVKGVSPVTDALIVQVPDTIGMLTTLEIDISRCYDKKPVIIICHLN